MPGSKCAGLLARRLVWEKTRCASALWMRTVWPSLAVKALEARTRDSAVLRERLTALEAANDELRVRLARLEALLERR